MAFNSETPRAEYTASEGQDTFPFLFKIFTNEDIVIYKTIAGEVPNDTTDRLILTVDYTVIVDGDAGGTAILVVPAGNGDAITVIRELDVDRDTEYQTNGDLLAETINDDQDYQTYLIADTAAGLDRFVKIPDSAQGVNATLPAPEANGYLKWNEEASALENDTTDFGTVAGNTENINIVANNIDDVILDAENIGDINIVAEAISSGAGIGGSQFIGAGLIKGIQYMSSSSIPGEVINIPAGTNAFSVDSFTLEDGATLNVPDNSTYKVI